MGGKLLTRKVTKKGRRQTLRQRGGATPTIYVVYFAYLDVGDKNWNTSRAKDLVTLQLKELKDVGLADAAKEVHVVYNSPKRSNFNNASALRLGKATKNAKSIIPKLFIHKERGNAFEYPALSLVWDIANNIPEAERANSVILYFHSKGMSNGSKEKVKTPENTELTDIVIKPWKDIVERFASDPAVNKAGHSASDTGFMWFNFWWARASYIVGCPRPILTERRHYYEDWVGRRKTSDANNNAEGKETGELKGPADCLSLCKVGPKGRLGVSLHPAFDKCVLETSSKA